MHIWSRWWPCVQRAAFYSNDPSSILAEVESEETKRNEILVDSYLTNNNKSKCNVQ